MLEARIRELTDSVGRMKSLEVGLVQLAEDLRYWLEQFRDSQQRRLSAWWRPDSWSRWRACVPESPLKQQLMAQLGASR